ncbi:MAG TPA: hypothetical protein VN701_00760 [Candidatus Paceibacterota bacterium]|nr:hypothetical protein [Candidatus Paceibacterota bacterium]
MKNKKKVAGVYSALGWVFAALGGIMIVIAATAWHANESLAWPVVTYATINLLASYGFFTRSKWLLPAFAATIIGLIVASIVLWSAYGMQALGLDSLLKLAIVAGILWFIYDTRRHLRSAPSDLYAGGLFLVLLLGSFSYTALLALS